MIILPLDKIGSGAAVLEKIDEIMKWRKTELISHIKLNDAVHNIDFGGPALIQAIQEKIAAQPAGSAFQPKIFLDLKVFDVSATLENTLRKYIDCQPDILTVSSQCSIDGIKKLRILLPKTKLAMVSALTDIEEEECRSRYGMVPKLKILNDLINISDLYKATLPEGVEDNPFEMVVCSAHEVGFLKKLLPKSYQFIVPGVRDEWMKKAGEHQKRVTGVGEAIKNGADFVVMGAQMMDGNPIFHISAEQSRSMTAFEIDKATKKKIWDPEPLAMLKQCGGYYKSPQDEKGKFLGPLVGYAGTYEDKNGAKKNYVGYEYFNFAKAEMIPDVRRAFAGLIKKGIAESDLPKWSQLSLPKIDVLLGAPMGGILLATELSGMMNVDVVFAEKKVISLPELADGKRAIENLVIDRHDLVLGSRVALVEDICNNFSTTQKIADLLKEKGCELVAILCAFNRSGKDTWNGVPVISACAVEARQFKQNDPEVIDSIAAGNVAWKPKLEWDKLAEAMNK